MQPAKRAQIVTLRQEGNSFTEIGAKLDVDPDTARKIFGRYSTSENYNSAPRSGRPRALNEYDARVIRRHVCHDALSRRQPLTEIKNALNIEVSNQTLQKFITEEIGLKRRVVRKTPWLSSKQKKKRLEFAKAYSNWGEEEWKHVIWSDEMPIQTSDNTGKVWVWRFPGEEYLEDCCVGTVQQGFEKIKIWAAVRYGAKSQLVILPEQQEGRKTTAQDYLNIVLNGELFKFWQASLEELGYIYVMEDGAPYHRGVASKRREELREMGWQGWGPGTWPANSPDLNPIEQIWHLLKSQVRKRKGEIHSKADLIAILLEEWERLPMEHINKVCLSMIRRLKAVKEKKGGPIGN